MGASRAQAPRQGERHLPSMPSMYGGPPCLFPVQSQGDGPLTPLAPLSSREVKGGQGGQGGLAGRDPVSRMGTVPVVQVRPSGGYPDTMTGRPMAPLPPKLNGLGV